MCLKTAILFCMLMIRVHNNKFYYICNTAINIYSICIWEKYGRYHAIEKQEFNNPSYTFLFGKVMPSTYYKYKTLYYYKLTFSKSLKFLCFYVVSMDFRSNHNCAVIIIIHIYYTYICSKMTSRQVDTHVRYMSYLSVC